MRIPFVLLLLFVVIAASNAQVKFRTGNVEIDADLNNINIEANADFGKFRTNLSLNYKIEEKKIDYFRTELRMEPAEIYYALEVSSVSGKPVDEVIEVYKHHRGHGWGNVSKRMGIKPGSDEFHQLKGHVRHRCGKEEKREDKDNKKGHHRGKGRGGEKKDSEREEHHGR